MTDGKSINQEEEHYPEYICGVHEDECCTCCTSKCCYNITPPCPWQFGTWARFIFLVLIVYALVVAAIFNPELGKFFSQEGPFRKFIDSLGPWGPVAYGGVYVICTVAMVPGTVLTLLAGVVFPNLLVAFATISLGSTAGACFAFLLGKTAMRSWVEKQAQQVTLFRAIDTAISKKGLLMVFLLRLSPAIPFNLLNYIISMTGINFFFYAIGSWIGMMPGTFLYVYIPWAAIHTANNASDTTQLIKNLVVFGAGGVATIVAVIIVSIFAKREIDKALKQEKEAKDREAEEDPTEKDHLVKSI